MTAKQHYVEAIVWIWLPHSTAPVVAGKLTMEGNSLVFNYGRSCLARDHAIAIYDTELPLQPGLLLIPDGLSMPGCIRDAAPDAWGRLVIINKTLGRNGKNSAADNADLGE